MARINEENAIVICTLLLTLLFAFAPFYSVLPLILALGVFLTPNGIIKGIICLSFFNIASMEGAPFWGGMSGCLLLLVILMLKQVSVMSSFFRTRFFLVFVVLTLVLSLNYLVLGVGYSHEKTALKSIIQQIIFVYCLCFFAFYMPKVSMSVATFLKGKFLIFFSAYVIFYMLYFLLVADSQRFGAALGPQALAMNVTFLFAFYLYSNCQKLALFMFIVVVFTGSRTYLLINLIIAFTYILYVYKDFASRVIVSVAAKVVVLLFAILAPFISIRLDYTHEHFWGSFWGRFQNYEVSWDMISSSPLFGNGIGSIVHILIDWIPESYFYYLDNGDTTIVHNEYLRIAVETGFIGIALYFWLLKNVMPRGSYGIGGILLIFLVSSLVENTIALYSTVMFMFSMMLTYQLENQAELRGEKNQ